MKRKYRTTDPDDTDRIEYLRQVIDVDGGRESVRSERPVRNGSGRVIGYEIEVTPETAEFVERCLADDAEGSIE